MSNNRGIGVFRRFGVVTIVSVYLLILAGGVVRTTGSGMGCPDWPRCFGRWIPPTDVSQLPPDYIEKYSVEGHSGVFNATQTWIEYINRLLGALIGIFAIIVVWLSFSFRKKDITITWLSVAVLALVIIEGIIGKYVVSSNLKPILVSVHMYGSIAIILLLIYVVSRSGKENLTTQLSINPRKMSGWVILLILVTLLQIFLGSRVRQEIDVITFSLNYENRELWIDQLSNIFLVHRSFSILLLILNLYILVKIYRAATSPIWKRLLWTSGILLLLEMTTGIIMNYLNIPAAAQPMHMLFGTMIIGAQFEIWVMLQYSTQTNTEAK